MFFDSLSDLGRILVVGPLAYLALVLFLRISGKRTLSKMNAFDLVVTVALGSTLATILLSRDVSMSEGALALALLIALQFVVAWLSVRSQSVRGVVKAQPALLLLRGEFLDEALRRERVAREEVLAALREQDVPSLQSASAVVLETDGTLSVLTAGDEKSHALSGVAKR